MMKFTSPTFIACRVQVALMSKTKKQQGASSLEYLVLAAAIIAIVGVLATNDTVKTTLTTAFENLFTSAASPA